MINIAVVAALVVALGSSCHAVPVPDSAGIVPMTDGLAYGGIPYGSISGQLATNSQQHQPTYYAYNSLQLPDTRTNVLTSVVY